MEVTHTSTRLQYTSQRAVTAGGRLQSRRRGRQPSLLLGMHQPGAQAESGHALGVALEQG